MKIPYKNITTKEMCELAEAGYELSCDADAKAVRINRVGFSELIIKELGQL